MGTISIKFTDEDEALIKKYAKLNKIDVSTFIREAVIERIEDEHDAALAEKIWEEVKDQEMISHEDLKKELGL